MGLETEMRETGIVYSCPPGQHDDLGISCAHGRRNLVATQDRGHAHARDCIHFHASAICSSSADRLGIQPSTARTRSDDPISTGGSGRKTPRSMSRPWPIPLRGSPMCIKSSQPSSRAALSDEAVHSRRHSPAILSVHFFHV